VAALSICVITPALIISPYEPGIDQLVGRFAKMKHCAKCNLDFPDTNRMCNNCGGLLTDAAATVGAAGKCPSCGAETQSGWKFCIVCSREIPQAPVEVSSVAGLTCQRCGNDNAAGLKFCTRCGNQLVALMSNQTQMLGSQSAQAPPGFPAQPQPGAPQPPPAQAQSGPSQPPPAWSVTPTCRNCGTAIPAGRSHCAVCGSPVAFYQPGPQAQTKRTPWIWVIVGVAALVLIVIAVSFVTYMTWRSTSREPVPVSPTVNPPPRVSTTPVPSTGGLAGLRVKVIYVPRRSADANRAAARLRERGMDIVMLEITDSGNGPHLGRVYSIKQYEQQARRIAEIVSDIEPVQFYEQEATFDVSQQFNLWIAK
jgi:DNA-directed RNA polymerase subunit M/transcription elongation factor TFIIS